MKHPQESPSDSPVTAEPTVAAAPDGTVALDDWCASKSRSMGRRIEALNAFYRRCQKQGVGREKPEELDRQFENFLKEPA